jgi:hypothetical protein
MDVTSVMHVHVALVPVVLVLVDAAAKKPKRLGGETGLTKAVTTAAAATRAAVKNPATSLTGSIK